jgi:hypothetical protein
MAFKKTIPTFKFKCNDFLIVNDMHPFHYSGKMLKWLLVHPDGKEERFEDLAQLVVSFHSPLYPRSIREKIQEQINENLELFIENFDSSFTDWYFLDVFSEIRYALEQCWSHQKSLIDKCWEITDTQWERLMFS